MNIKIYFLTYVWMIFLITTSTYILFLKPGILEVFLKWVLSWQRFRHHFSMRNRRYVGIRFTFLVQKFLLVFRYPVWSPDNCEAFFQPLLTLILGSKIPPPSVPCGIEWRYKWLIPFTGSWTSEGLGLWHERKKSGMKAHEDEDSWGLCHWRNTVSLTWSFSGGLICEEASKTFNI